MKKHNGKHELPLGLGMALAQNRAAMKAFASMSDEAQREYIAKAHGAESKSDMQAIVDSMTDRRAY